MPSLATQLAALTAAARAILPASVAVATSDPTAAAQPLWLGETLRGAVDSRLREFAAGRAAARQAFALLGVDPAAIPQGPDRAPVWPTGITGSITHSATLCLAAVTRDAMLIGIDLEPDTPLAPDLWDTVLLPAEQEMLRSNSNAPLLAKRIFSAKEAAYKAQYARSKTLFGFDVIQIILSDSSFTARFTTSVPNFPAGTTLHGRAISVANHILTAVTG
ncbi:4'-phosphopantetheinyl transferase family protein [Pseudorhodobacter ferrugineus]|uniref:4'-phosphopantetheinyl transferase family protein n=1 Tax=Pseudorhodobacter ferrugineus TaxID=77008 RepID=UPI0003B3B2ED|nr:4'-phosphopantetheinyl transferase superfamily protein [Pseudorhodobacter ferrugineus]